MFIVEILKNTKTTKKTKIIYSPICQKNHYYYYYY